MVLKPINLHFYSFILSGYRRSVALVTKKDKSFRNEETQKKMTDEWTNTNKVGVGFGIGFKGFELKTQVDTDLSHAGKNSKEDVEKFMQEAKNTVQWDGSKFVPTPMELSRLNLAKLRDTQTFKDRSVKVSYRTAVLTVGILTPIEAQLNSTDSFTELQLQFKRFNADLQSQLKQTNERIDSKLYIIINHHRQSF